MQDFRTHAGGPDTLLGTVCRNAIDMHQQRRFCLRDVAPKHGYPPTRLHGVMPQQRTTLVNVAAKNTETELD